jgi:hypothetical protein
MAWQSAGSCANTGICGRRPQQRPGPALSPPARSCCGPRTTGPVRGTGTPPWQPPCSFPPAACPARQVGSSGSLMVLCGRLRRLLVAACLAVGGGEVTHPLASMFASHPNSAVAVAAYDNATAQAATSRRPAAGGCGWPAVRRPAAGCCGPCTTGGGGDWVGACLGAAACIAVLGAVLVEEIDRIRSDPIDCCGIAPVGHLHHQSQGQG